MATTEEVIGRTEDGRIIVYFENAGDSSYSQANNQSINIGSLRAVERILELGNNAGYRVEPEEASISGNSITFPVRFYGFACPGAAGTEVCSVGFEVPDGNDISNITFSGIAIGH